MGATPCEYCGSLNEILRCVSCGAPIRIVNTTSIQNSRAWMALESDSLCLHDLLVLNDAQRKNHFYEIAERMERRFS